MGRSLACIALLCAFAATMTGAAQAAMLRSGNVVDLTGEQPVEEDVLAAGNQVVIDRPVSGDVTAVGQSVVVRGAVEDSVILAGSNVRVDGAVGNDARLAGGTVSLNSSVADNAYLAGGTVSVPDEGSVANDLFVAGGQLNLLGDVGGNVRAAGSDISIGGTVGGNVYARADRVRIPSTAVIRGDLRYTSPNEAQIEPGAQILGETARTEPTDRPRFWSRAAQWFLGLLAAIVFGIVLITLFPLRSSEAADTIRASFWPSLGVGFLALVAVPVACIILGVTIIGIPLAIAAFLIYLVLLYVGWILTAFAVGRWILGRRSDAAPRPLWSLVLGVVVLAVVGLIPVLGWLAMLVAVVLGLGALLLSWWKGRPEQRQAVRRPQEPTEPTASMGPPEPYAPEERE